MGDYDFPERIKSFEKELKVNWERLISNYKEGGLDIEQLREFKADTLIPILSQIIDLSFLVIERKKKDLYDPIVKFFRDVINYSTYYQRNKHGLNFNFSSETEHLSVLLPGYEGTVGLFMVGAVASVEENYEFVSMVASKNVLWLINNKGKKIYKSIVFYPWFENRFRVGNLTSFFEEAKKRLYGDELLKERYFSLIDDVHVDHLCQYDFLARLRVDMMGQNEEVSFPYFPNFARYEFSRIEELIQRFVNREERLVASFPITESDFRNYMNSFMERLKISDIRYEYEWLEDLPDWFYEFLNSS